MTRENTEVNAGRQALQNPQAKAKYKDKAALSSSTHTAAKAAGKPP